MIVVLYTNNDMINVDGVSIIHDLSSANVHDIALLPYNNKDTLKMRDLTFGGKSDVVVNDQQCMLYDELTCEANKYACGRTSIDQLPVDRIIDTIMSTVMIYCQSGLVTTSYNKIGLKLSFKNDETVKDLVVEGEIGEIEDKDMELWKKQAQYTKEDKDE